MGQSSIGADNAAATGFANWGAATERYMPVGAFSSTHIDRPKPSGTAFWFDAPPPYQVTWAAVVSGEHLRFVSAPAMPRFDWTLPRSSKAERQATWSEAERRRVSELHGACDGPCLTWSARAGWEVLPSASPSAGPSKRHRLLGVPGAPRVWVFAWGGGFAARVCEIRVQAFGATAREVPGVNYPELALKTIVGRSAAQQAMSAGRHGAAPAGVRT